MTFPAVAGSDRSTRGSPPDDETLLSTAQVRARYGNVSDMTIWRWQNKASLNFPRPLVINKRRYWRLGQLRAFDASRALTAEAVA